jgi:glyoxylase-like metal-dependent hydrolase (beta-lactamase superfamily II)
LRSRSTTTPRPPRTLSIALVLTSLFFLSACDLNKTVLAQALKGFIAYFDTPVSSGSALTRLSPHVLTFNWYFDRTLVIETDAGLVVVDPFSEHLSGALRTALDQAGVDAPVHTLIYTHYHIDHTRGGARLEPLHVICHERCDRYWEQLPASDTADVLRPTRTVAGDQRLEIGGVVIDLIALEESHTDTMYAVHVPGERLVFAADTVGLGVMLPAGGVDVYMPAYLRALDRIEAIDFDTFVSSHFGWGTREEFIAAADLQRDGYRWAREALDRYGVDASGIAMTQDEERFLAAFDYFYDRMKAKYGDWHGFDAMILNTFMNNVIALTVGS